MGWEDDPEAVVTTPPPKPQRWQDDPDADAAPSPSKTQRWQDDPDADQEDAALAARSFPQGQQPNTFDLPGYKAGHAVAVPGTARDPSTEQVGPDGMTDTQRKVKEAGDIPWQQRAGVEAGAYKAIPGSVYRSEVGGLESAGLGMAAGVSRFLGAKDAGREIEAYRQAGSRALDIANKDSWLPEGVNHSIANVTAGLATLGTGVAAIPLMMADAKNAAMTRAEDKGLSGTQAEIYGSAEALYAGLLGHLLQEIPGLKAGTEVATESLKSVLQEWVKSSAGIGAQQLASQITAGIMGVDKIDITRLPKMVMQAIGEGGLFTAAGHVMHGTSQEQQDINRGRALAEAAPKGPLKPYAESVTPEEGAKQLSQEAASREREARLEEGPPPVHTSSNEEWAQGAPDREIPPPIERSGIDVNAPEPLSPQEARQALGEEFGKPNLHTSTPEERAQAEMELKGGHPEKIGEFTSENPAGAEALLKAYVANGGLSRGDITRVFGPIERNDPLGGKEFRDNFGEKLLKIRQIQEASKNGTKLTAKEVATLFEIKPEEAREYTRAAYGDKGGSPAPESGTVQPLPAAPGEVGEPPVSERRGETLNAEVQRSLGKKSDNPAWADFMLQGDAEEGAAVKAVTERVKAGMKGVFLGIDIVNQKGLNTHFVKETEADKHALGPFAAILKKHIEAVPGVEDVLYTRKPSSDNLGVHIVGGDGLDAETVRKAALDANEEMRGVAVKNGIPLDLENPRAKKPKYKRAGLDAEDQKVWDSEHKDYLLARGVGVRVGVVDVTPMATSKSLWDRANIQHEDAKHGQSREIGLPGSTASKGQARRITGRPEGEGRGATGGSQGARSGVLGEESAQAPAPTGPGEQASRAVVPVSTETTTRVSDRQALIDEASRLGLKYKGRTAESLRAKIEEAKAEPQREDFRKVTQAGQRVTFLDSETRKYSNGKVIQMHPKEGMLEVVAGDGIVHRVKMDDAKRVEQFTDRDYFKARRAWKSRNEYADVPKDERAAVKGAAQDARLAFTDLNDEAILHKRGIQADRKPHEVAAKEVRDEYLQEKGIESGPRGDAAAMPELLSEWFQKKQDDFRQGAPTLASVEIEKRGNWGVGDSMKLGRQEWKVTDATESEVAFENADGKEIRFPADMVPVDKGYSRKRGAKIETESPEDIPFGRPAGGKSERVEPKPPGDLPEEPMNMGAGLPLPSGKEAGGALRWVTRKLAGESAPKTTDASQPAGEALVRHAAAKIAVKPMVDDMYQHVTDGDEAVGNKLGAVLTEDNLRDVRKQKLKAGNTAAAAKVGTLVGKHDGAQFENEAEYQAAKSDPKIQEALKRWKEAVNPWMDEQYKTLTGRDPDAELASRGAETGARINLKAVRDDEVPTAGMTGGGGNLSNPRANRSPFAKTAKGTAESYDTNLKNILENSVAKTWVKATRLRMYDALVKSGNAVYGEGGKPPMIGKEETVGFEVKLPTQTKENKTAYETKMLYVKKSLAKELRGALNVDAKMEPHAAASLINNLQLLGVADAGTHVVNILTAINANPGAKSWLGELARKVPGVNIVDTISRVAKAAYDVSKNDPQALRDIRRLAEEGALRGPEYGHGRVARLIGAIDKTSRLVMSRMFDNLVKRGLLEDSPTSRREFVNQLGQYNPALQGEIIRALRQTGMAPFVTAGTNFNRLGIRALTGQTAGRSVNKTAAANLMGMNIVGNVVLPVATAAALSYLFAGGRSKGVPWGGIDTGKKDEDGNPIYVDLLKYTGVRRGLAATGIGKVLEGLEAGHSSGRNAAEGIASVVNSWVHPYAGPVPQAIFKTATGYDMAVSSDGKSLRRAAPAAEADENQFAVNALTAAKELNPSVEAGLKGAKDAGEKGGSKLAGGIKHGLLDVAEGWAGVKVGHPSTSHAEDLAHQLYKKRVGDKQYTEEEDAKQSVRRGIKRDIAGGASVEEAKKKAMATGKVTETEAMLSAKEGGMTEQQQIFKRLDVKEAARVMKVATPEEKKVWSDMYDDKVGNLVARVAALPPTKGDANESLAKKRERWQASRNDALKLMEDLGIDRERGEELLRKHLKSLKDGEVKIKHLQQYRRVFPATKTPVSQAAGG